MIQSEQILEYIDGLLDPDAEQALFDAMALQPELRSALRQFITIAEAVRADREAYTPPADVEHALMNGLGLASMLPYAEAAAGVGWRAGLFSFVGKFWGMMLSFLLGVLLAGSVVVYLADSPAWPEQHAAGVNASGPTDGQTAAAGPDAVATQSSGAAAAEPHGGVHGNTSAADMRSANTSDLQAGSNARLDNDVVGNRLSSSTRSGGGNARGDGRGSGRRSSGANQSGLYGAAGAERHAMNGDGYGGDATLLPDITASAPVASSADAAMQAHAVTPVDARAVALPPARAEAVGLFASHVPNGFLQISSLADGPAGEGAGMFALEARGNLGGAFSPNAARRTTSSTDNLMLGFLGYPSESFAVGLELGKESYDQTLYYYDEDTLQIEQRPSYMWLGATGRLYIGAIVPDGAEAFLQGTLAYSTGGPIVRFRIGGQMPLSPAFDLMVGLETSGLIYTFRDQQFISGRWGATGGVQWKPW